MNFKTLAILSLVFVVLSCNKDKNKDYTLEYIGVYTAQRTNSNETFTMLIDKKDDDTLLITTKWININQTVKAVCNKNEFTIPFQYTNSTVSITGNGSLINGKTITVDYYTMSQSMRIIASK